MEASLSYIKTHHFQTLSLPTIKNISILSSPIATNLGGRSLKFRQQSWWQNSQTGFELVAKCAKPSPPPELEREIEDEMNSEEGWNEIGERWREKCKGRRGIVELLECLEREAIMGEDEGREPTDYNRRAHIFDKSSRLFQALKENNIQDDS